MGPSAAPAVGQIIKLLGDPDDTIRANAVETLQCIAPPGPEEILPMLADSSLRVLEAALPTAEARIPKAKSQVVKIGKLLEHPEDKVRSHAARVLVK